MFGFCRIRDKAELLRRWDERAQWYEREIISGDFQSAQIRDSYRVIADNIRICMVELQSL